MRGEPTSEAVSERELFAPGPSFSPPTPERARLELPAPNARGGAPAAPFRGWLWRPIRLSRQTGASALRSFASASALEVDRGILFLCVPVAMVVGVYGYLALPVEPSLAALLAATAFLAVLALLARNRRPLQLALAALLVIVLGATFARFETWRAGTKMLGGEIATRLTGSVVDIDHLANGRVRLTIDVTGTERPALRYAPQRVRVSASSLPDGVVAGSSISGPVRLFPPSGPLRPGSYDFAFESYFDRIGANGFFLGKPALTQNPAPLRLADRVRASADNFRNGIAAHIRESIGGPEGEIAAALIVGVRAGIPEPVNESLRRTGLAHILSISGLHMALVAASIMGGLRLVFAFFPDFASRHAVKKVAAGAALVTVAAYLLVSGAEVAAQRSFIMLAVMLVAVMFDRAALTMRNLAIAAIIVLAISPHEVIGPSFQMSFAATAALIGGYAAWSERRQTRVAAYAPHGLARSLLSTSAKLIAGVALTALIAGLATTIYGAWHFQRVSPLSLVANLAVTPIISIVMWASVFATAAMPFGLDGPFLSIVGGGLSAMIAISDWLSARSPLDAIGTVPAGAVAAFTLALLVATLATTRLRLAAIPLALLGLAMLVTRTMPDILIAEDGRLVGVRGADGSLAVNRARPNAFTTSDWQRAVRAGTVVKPGSKPQDTNNAAQFQCKDKVCTLAHPSGVTIVHAEQAAAARRFCEVSAIVITSDATVARPCRSGQARVITARELAQRGASAIRLEAGASGPLARISFAVSQPYRPWHDQRRFSREARGIAPYEPQKKAAKSE